MRQNWAVFHPIMLKSNKLLTWTCLNMYMFLQQWKHLQCKIIKKIYIFKLTLPFLQKVAPLTTDKTLRTWILTTTRIYCVHAKIRCYSDHCVKAHMVWLHINNIRLPRAQCMAPVYHCNHITLITVIIHQSFPGVYPFKNLIAKTCCFSLSYVLVY